MPVGEWFKGALHGWLRDTLTRSELCGTLLEHAEVMSMLDRHRDGSGNFTRELRALAALALWHKDVQAQGLAVA